MLASSLCGRKPSTSPAGRQHNIQPQPLSANSHTCIVLATSTEGRGQLSDFFSSHVGSKHTHFSNRHLKHDDDKRWKRKPCCDGNTTTKSWRIIVRLPSVASLYAFYLTLEELCSRRRVTIAAKRLLRLTASSTRVFHSESYNPFVVSVA